MKHSFGCRVSATPEGWATRQGKCQRRLSRRRITGVKRRFESRRSRFWHRASFRGDEPVRRPSGSSGRTLPAASPRRSCRRPAKRDRTALRAADGASPGRLRAPTRGRSRRAAPPPCRAAGQTAACAALAPPPALADGERIRSWRDRPASSSPGPDGGKQVGKRAVESPLPDSTLALTGSVPR